MPGNLGKGGYRSGNGDGLLGRLLMQLDVLERELENIDKVIKADYPWWSACRAIKTNYHSER